MPLVACRGCRGPLSTEAAACPRCGTPAAHVERRLELALVGNDAGHRLFSAEEVKQARFALIRETGSVPPLDVFVAWYGRELADAVWKRVAQRRMDLLVLYRDAEEMERAPRACDLCGRFEGVHRLPFAFGNVLGEETDWSGTAGTAAASAVTLALFGVGAVRGPGRKTVAKLLRLDLRLCEPCHAARRGLLGVKIRAADAQRHPVAPRAMDFGFTRFHDERELAKFV
jgi:ribosomal protein S14